MFSYDAIARMALTLPAFLIVLSVHEASHALVSFLLGDDTAKRDGRLSLNPLVHIDPLGLICLLLFRVGWAKPVEFDPLNFKKPRTYSVLTAYAGPLSNFLLALVVFVFIRFLPVSILPNTVAVTMIQLLDMTAWVSVMLGVFNLIPLPPLDGSHILMVTVLYRFPRLLFWLQRYSLILLIFCIAIFPQSQKYLILVIDWTYNFLHKLVF